MPGATECDLHHLRRAARLALRGHGRVEPNPMVGCVIVSPDHRVVGWGHHQMFGGPHAEVIALRRAGPGARGATAYVTLEPCKHHGKTPPCTEALIAAGVRRVVFARPDPHPQASGGAQRLQDAGIQVEHVADCFEAAAVSEPFAHRIRTGLPWVIAKWAQTIDGAIATRGGDSRWISGQRSRRMVHRQRGRVDAILTGIGTVLADDPLLTARGVRVRRVARRIVFDPRFQMPANSRLAATAREVPTIVACAQPALEADARRAASLRDAGVELMPLPARGDDLSLTAALRELVSRFDATTVMIEAGAGMLGRAFRERVVCEAWVFIGPLLLGDQQAMPAARGIVVERLTDGTAMTLTGMHRRGPDVLLRYRVAGNPYSAGLSRSFSDAG